MTDDEVALIATAAEKVTRERDSLRVIAETAREMRAAQRRYFKDRTQSALVESKRLEKELDRLLDHFKSNYV